jgi:hypothetical protein
LCKWKWCVFLGQAVIQPSKFSPTLVSYRHLELIRSPTSIRGRRHLTSLGAPNRPTAGASVRYRVNLPTSADFCLLPVHFPPPALQLPAIGSSQARASLGCPLSQVAHARHLATAPRRQAPRAHACLRRSVTARSAHPFCPKPSSAIKSSGQLRAILLSPPCFPASRNSVASTTRAAPSSPSLCRSSPVFLRRPGCPKLPVDPVHRRTLSPYGEPLCSSFEPQHCHHLGVHCSISSWSVLCRLLPASISSCCLHQPLCGPPIFF